MNELLSNLNSGNTTQHNVTNENNYFPELSGQLAMTNNCLGHKLQPNYSLIYLLKQKCAKNLTDNVGK